MRRAISCGLATIAAILVGSPAPAAQTLLLQAESSNAMGVTGDLRFSPSQVVFSNGARMPIKSVARDVWRVVDQPDRGLIENNTLCGAPVTYLTLHRDPAGLLILNLTTGDRQPATPAAETFAIDGTCAVYVYLLKAAVGN